VHTSFAQRYLTSVNNLGKLLLSCVPVFFFFSFLLLYQQNFTAGPGGVTAWVSGPPSRESKLFRCFALMPEELGREHVET
jgi:hypothetical protein